MQQCSRGHKDWHDPGVGLGLGLFILLLDGDTVFVKQLVGRKERVSHVSVNKNRVDLPKDGCTGSSLKDERKQTYHARLQWNQRIRFLLRRQRTKTQPTWLEFPFCGWTILGTGGQPVGFRQILFVGDLCNCRWVQRKRAMSVRNHQRHRVYAHPASSWRDQ